MTCISSHITSYLNYAASYTLNWTLVHESKCPNKSINFQDTMSPFCCSNRNEIGEGQTLWFLTLASKKDTSFEISNDCDKSDGRFPCHLWTFWNLNACLGTIVTNHCSWGAVRCNFGGEVHINCPRFLNKLS